ncbi:MAG: DegT/DnrJ/EryC1/StrS family aminotransferase [Bacteroidota bacterium]
MIPFSPPRIDQKIIDEVVDTLKSGWITTGPKTKRFEKELAAYCDVPSVLCLNSATAGLELMLRWFGIGPGDEVILPAYTYSATANVILHCGATPVFVDIGSDFNINPEKVREAISSSTKAIMPVDFAGLPCDYDSLNSIIRDKEINALFRPAGENQVKLGRIFLLSDAAHSLGGRYQGRLTGSLADATVFSFHAVKNLTTAEGGAVALNFPSPFDNQAIYQSLCIKSLHGQNKDALAKMQRGNWRYDIVEPGYKMNMTDISASIGLVELSRYESETLPARKRICNTYDFAFAAKSWAILPDAYDEKRESSYHLYPLRIRGVSETERDEIIRLISEQDVTVNVHFIPVPMMSHYIGLGYDIHRFPETYSNYSSEISLPVFFDLTSEQQTVVIRIVIGAVEEVLNK